MTSSAARAWPWRTTARRPAAIPSSSRRSTMVPRRGAAGERAGRPPTPERPPPTPRRSPTSGSTTRALRRSRSPITNEAGLLQVSPSNSYTGLTRSLPHVTEPGEPEKYVPLGRRTYGRIAVTDAREADALAEYLVVLGVRRAVLVDDAEIYGSGLAHLLRRRLPGVGVRVVRSIRLDVNDVRGFARRELRHVRADAMVFTGITDNGAVPLWHGVARAHPRWKLLGASGVAEPRFARRVRSARRPADLSDRSDAGRFGVSTGGAGVLRAVPGALRSRAGSLRHQRLRGHVRDPRFDRPRGDADEPRGGRRRLLRHARPAVGHRRVRHRSLRRHDARDLRRLPPGRRPHRLGSRPRHLARSTQGERARRRVPGNGPTPPLVRAGTPAEVSGARSHGRGSRAWRASPWSPSCLPTTRPAASWSPLASSASPSPWRSSPPERRSRPSHCTPPSCSSRRSSASWSR